MCARRDHDVHETASRRIAVESELGFFDPFADREVDPDHRFSPALMNS